jgi:hypothetical protein
MVVELLLDQLDVDMLAIVEFVLGVVVLIYAVDDYEDFCLYPYLVLAKLLASLRPFSYVDITFATVVNGAVGNAAG